MAYLWLTDAEIQPFLNPETVIGSPPTGNYLSTKAQVWENLIVRTMVDFLTCAYTITTTASDPYLKLLAAQWTAAAIASGHMGTSVGLPDWTDRYKNEVLSALTRKIRIQSDITGITKKIVPLHERLIYAKTMEQTVVAE